MTCAKCGEDKELCGSCRSDGVQQPRLCKDCVILAMSTGDHEINETLWIRQLFEAGDGESLKNLEEQLYGSEGSKQ